MADRQTGGTTQGAPPTPVSPTQTGDQGGETHLSLAVKSVFWLILVPAAVLLMAKWLLQP